MNILITGGSGFIGSHLIKKLLKIYTNIQIFSIDNYLSGSPNNDYIENKRIIYLNNSSININKIPILNQVKFDILFHFGEYSRISTSFEEPNVVFENNLTGTYQVLEFCRKNKCKLVYSGSSSIFGNNMNDQHHSPYSWSKAKNIELIKNYHKWYNLQFTIVYFSNVYGAGQISEGKYATLIGIFENLYKNRKPLSVVKPGTQTRRFTHINDTILTCYEAWKRNKCLHYSISNKNEFSIIDVAKMFGSKIVYLPKRKGERYASALTNMSFNNKVHKRFGKIGLKEYINSFIKNQKK